MKKIFLSLLLISLFSISAQSQIVNFTNVILKDRLLEANESNGIAKNQLAENIIVDINDDGELSEEELLEVFHLDLDNTGLTSMDELILLINLTSVRLEGNNFEDHLVLPELPKVENLYLLDNPNLISVYGQNLYKLANFYVDESIDSLALINCLRLFYISLQTSSYDNLEYLYLEGANRITEMDLSNFNGNKVHLINCNDIETILIDQDLINVFHIENLPDLENIDDGNILTAKDTIIIKDCPLIVDIDGRINLEGENYVNISNCSLLESATVIGQGGSGTGNTTADISNNGQIKNLQLNSINDGFIDLESMPNIETFDFRYSNFDLLNFGSIDYPNLTFMNLINTNGTALDLANCIALETLWIKGWAIINELHLPNSNTLQTLTLEGNNNAQKLELPNIDFSNCTALTDINLRYIDTEELSITSSPNLESFYFYNSSVQSLELSNNLLTSLYLGSFGINMESLSVYNCSSLSSISISSDSLNSLEISQLPSLEYLSIYEGLLTDLSIEDIPNLKTISCSNSSLTNLDISNTPALEELNCSDNNLSSVNISNTPTLTELDCSYNNLSSINISDFNQLKIFNCQNNNLLSLDLSNAPLIESINASNNSIVDINIENCINIKSLYLNNNSIAVLNLPDCQNLTSLNCQSNELTNLDVINKSNLKYLYCQNNNIADIILENLPELTNVQLQNNNLDTLRYIDLPKLNSFNLNDSLKVLEFNNCPAISTIIVEDLHKLEDLKVKNCENTEELRLLNLDNENLNIENENNPNLERLRVSNITIPSLDLSMFPTVKYFHFFGTPFETIDFSNNPSLLQVYINNSDSLNSVIFNDNNLLNSIDINNTNISSVEITNTSMLENIDLNSNQITSFQANQFPMLKTLNLGNNPLEEVFIVSNNSNLESLYLYTTNVKDLDASNNPNLTFINIDYEDIKTLNIDNCSNLSNMNSHDFDDLKSLSAKNCLALTSISLFGNDSLLNVDLLNCTGLTYFSCQVSPLLELLNLNNCTNLEQVNLSFNSLLEFNVDNLNSLTSLTLNQNNITNLNINDLPNLDALSCSDNSISNLSITNTPSLTYLNVNNNQLVSLNLSQMTNLKNLAANNNLLESLDLSNCTDLETLDIGYNAISSLNIEDSNQLINLKCNNNLIQSLIITDFLDLSSIDVRENNLQNLQITNCPELENVQCQNNLLYSINFSQTPELNILDCSFNNLTTINLDTLNNFNTLICNNNNITELNCDNTPNLEFLNCSFNNLTNLDLGNTNVANFNTESNQLESLFLRNGEITTTATRFNNNPNLIYICCDAPEIQTVEILTTLASIPNCVVNNNCPAPPGQFLFSFLQFGSILDLDDNGCDLNTDIIIPYSKFSITGNDHDGTYHSSNTGGGELFLTEGNYEVEHVNSLSPVPNIQVTFNSEPDTATAYFCVVPDSLYFDLDVSIFNNTIRPGFDFSTTIILKNNGVTPISGVLDFYFEDNYINYNSSSPNYTELEGGLMQWDFDDLIPFESRIYTINFTANTPTDSEYPVNIGDELAFSTLANPTEDDFDPSDNYAGMKTTVVGSYDPNDKTCVEGTTILPEMIGDYLTYKIRFENTGTYYAENVLIVDIIDITRFDISTLTPIAGSHDFQTRVTGNKVEFAFDNIFLPFEDDENDGWVLFKIKTLDELTIGQEIKNTAEIYFDYNAPIITNEETTTVTQIVNTHTTNESVDFSFYPNPTMDIVNYNSEDQIRLIEIFDINGRLIRSQKENKNTINVEALSAGTYILKVTTNKGSKGFKFNKL